MASSSFALVPRPCFQKAGETTPNLSKNWLDFWVGWSKMGRMLLKRWIAGSLAIFLCTQFLFLGSGLLGYCLESNSKICQCNHGSKKEKHGNAEDQLFSEDRETSVTLSHSHESENTSEVALKPSCHDAKSGEAHLCSCKKQKKDALSLRTHHQTMDRPSLTFGLVKSSVIIYTINESPFTLVDGDLPNLLRPPRI